MTEVIATILGGTTAGLIATVIWLVAKYVGKTDADADSRVGQAVTEELLKQSQFELEQTKQALARQTARADALEKEFADGIAQPVNTDLAADDVRGRVLRVLQAWRASDTAAGQVPAEPASPVHQEPAPKAT